MKTNYLIEDNIEKNETTLIKIGFLKNKTVKKFNNIMDCIDYLKEIQKKKKKEIYINLKVI